MLTGDVVGVMAEALGAELARTKDPALSFAERFGLIVEQQWTTREASRLARRLKNAAQRTHACAGNSAVRSRTTTARCRAWLAARSPQRCSRCL